jgi:lipid-A-disaccharide synthase
MRIFFSVGEPSGDLHGSNLIRRLRTQAEETGEPEFEFVGFGGPKMADAGCELIYDLTSLAIMFIGEAVKNLRFFFGLVDKADDYFAEHNVDAVVLIDYPGFNWWIARKAKKRGIPVFYYGVPQMWAWAPWRVRKIRKFVDHVLCKLPFEVDWFAKRKCQATYVGHPYFDQIKTQSYDEAFMDSIGQQTGPLLTLLPGSRNQEVKSVLPLLLNAVEKIQASSPQCRFAIAAFKETQAEFAKELVESRGLPVEVYTGRTPELMKQADVCLACSGSVSLELLHYRKPTIIVFKVKRWIMCAQAFLLRTKFITLVNLIASNDIKKRTWAPFDPDAEGADEAVMPEYLTMSDPSESVAKRAIVWLNDESARKKKIAEMDQLAKKYAKPGATERAADFILSKLLESRRADTVNDQTNTLNSVSKNPDQQSNKQDRAA